MWSDFNSTGSTELPIELATMVQCLLFFLFIFFPGWWRNDLPYFASDHLNQMFLPEPLPVSPLIPKHNQPNQRRQQVSRALIILVGAMDTDNPVHKVKTDKLIYLLPKTWAWSVNMLFYGIHAQHGH